MSLEEKAKKPSKIPMNDDEKTIRVTLVKANCRACGKSIIGSSEDDVKKRLEEHVEKECKVIKQLKEWEKQGIRKER